MTIRYPPFYGQVLICAFPDCHVSPEMTKRRPVICLSPTNRDRYNLVTVVPLSTTESKNDDFAVKVTLEKSVSEHFNAIECWAKCDMLYTFSFSRFSLPGRGKDANGNRLYSRIIIDKETMKEIVEKVTKSISEIEK